MTRLYIALLITLMNHKINEWYDNNHLVINASKSSIMVVTTKQRDAFNNLLNIDVCLGADSLDQSNCID